MSGPDSKEPGRFSLISTKSQGDVFEGHFFIIFRLLRNLLAMK